MNYQLLCTAYFAATDDEKEMSFLIDKIREEWPNEYSKEEGVRCSESHVSFGSEGRRSRSNYENQNFSSH